MTQTGFLMAFLITTSSFHVRICVPESGLISAISSLLRRAVVCIAGHFFSPVGQSAAEQEGPPETWKDAV